MGVHLAEQGLDRLHATYWDHGFFVERDVVWTLQRWLRETVRREGLPFRIFHDYPIVPKPRRALCTDLAILTDAGEVAVAVEIKYEPDHARGVGDAAEIWPTKLNPSVVFWGKDGVLHDVERCQHFVAEDRCQTAMSLFIDEGGAFRHRPPHPGTRWIDWEYGGAPRRRVSVLRGIFGKTVH